MSVYDEDLDRDACFVKSAVMAKGGKATISQIGQLLNISYATTCRYVDHCVELGLIKETEKNTFEVMK